tara:strand:- start:564 stop:791 length:228 start_codon:yes stop_codon:yes gene_type:complete
MKNKRIVKEDNRYFPEHYKDKYLFGLLGGYWKRYRTDELWLNGYWTELIECDLSYPDLQEAKDYFNESKKEIIQL